MRKVEQALEKERFDIIISDYSLPGFTGLDVIALLKEKELDTPLILVSGTVPDETAIDAVLAGAKDYVLKDNLRRLNPAIRRELKASQEHQEKVKADRLLEAVFNSSVGIRISNQSHIIVKVNQAYCEMMGYTQDELVGADLSLLIPKSRIEDEKLRFNELLEGEEEHFQATGREIRKDGSSVDLLTKTTVVEEENQKLLVHSLQDVTDVFKYKVLFEESGRIAKLGGWERDIETGKEVWTKEIYDIYGVTEDTFDPKSESDERFHTKDSYDLMKASMKAATVDGIPFDIELEIVDSDGNKKWCRGTGKPVYEAGRIVKLIGSFQDITLQKERELELEKSEEKYRFLFENSPNPMLIFEVDTDQIKDVNNAAINLYGYSHKEFLTMKSIDLRPTEYKEWYKKIAHKFDPNSNETRYFPGITHQKANGEDFLVDIFARYTQIEGKNANIVVFNDVTEKSKNERELIRTNNLLKTLISNAPIGLMLINREGRVEELWNPKAEEIFGWTSEEVLGKKLPYVQKIKEKEFADNLKRGFEEKKPFIIEIERVRKDGTPIVLKEFITPLLDDKGEVINLMILNEDITETKKIETALKGSEQKYRNLVEASRDLIWRIDKEGNFSFINTASTKILGYEPEEIIGNPFVPFVNESKVEEAIGIHQSVVSGNVYENFSLEMVTKDGEIRKLSATAYPMRDNDGTIIGCSGTATDITHILEYQQKLESSLKEKEVLIKEIHHRVKNNLAVISGLFALQAMKIDDEKVIQLFNESQSRIKSIASIHEKLYQNDLLTSIEISSYLKDLLEDIKNTFRRSGKEIDVSVEGDEVTLNVNQAVPFGILANELITNTFKYAFPEYKKGAIKLTIKKEGKEIVFKVEDNGVGLPENFEEMKKGSLGMTLVLSLTDQLNGELTWKSESGAKFELRFPPAEMHTWANKM